MSDTERDTGDTNVERLLSAAYQPEQPDAEFVASEKERLRALAAQVAKNLEEGDVTQASDPSPANGAAAPIVFPFQQPWMIAVAAAALVAVGIGIGLASRGEAETAQPQPGYRLDGDVVWVDGKPFVSRGAVRSRDPQPVRPRGTKPQAGAKSGRKPAQVAVGRSTRGLTPHKRTAPKPAALAKQGATLATKAGERRRVQLADGSVLYLNENTTLRIRGPRRVDLERGELFVEVSPRAKGSSGATFVVKTPKRTVSALGTKFGVVAEKVTRVLVTQGAVKVSGVEQALGSGWQLHASSAGEVEVEPLSRMDRELDWTRELIAAADTPLVPKSKHAGGALIAVDPHGQETKLTLRKYRVDVHIEDGFARTTIDQTYFNHQWWRMEGTFYFPLPAGAAISRLAMYVNGKLMEGGMAEKNYARSVYEQIRFTRRDPALLEWLDGSTFKMRVFPLEGRQEKRIVLSYTQRLESVYGQAQYRFPAAHTLGLVKDLAFHVRVVGHGERGWKSPSHTLKPSPAAGDLVLDMSAQRALINKDLVLELQQEPKRTPRPRFSSVVHEGSRYLMLRYRPRLLPQQGAASRRRAPRSWVFLYESSGDRDPLLARTQLETIRTFLENAEHQDEFSILTAGTRLRTFAKDPRAVSRDNVRAAMTFLESTHLIGALDLDKALKATQPLVERARQRKREVVLVHLGSGIPVLGQRSQKELVAQVPRGARYVGIGVGKRWERAFMKAAASKTGGLYAQVNPDDEVRWRSYELFSLLNTRSLQGLTVKGGKAEFRLADDVIYDGGEVCAVTRLPAGQAAPESLVLSGLVQGKPWTHTIPVSEVRAKASYLPRYWAKLEVDRLVGLGAKKHKQAIVALSKAMYVMSPFTSLLVLENEAMYKQFKVDRGRKDHWALYPCPKRIKVVRETGDRAVAQTAPGTKPSRHQVLATIMVRFAPQVLYWPGRNRYYGQRVATVAQIVAGTHGYGWLHNWRDWQSGRTGMRQWAQRNELTRDRTVTFGGGNRALMPSDGFRPMSGPVADPAVPMDALRRVSETARAPRGRVSSRWGLRAATRAGSGGRRLRLRGDLDLSVGQRRLIAGFGDEEDLGLAQRIVAREKGKKESADSLLERFRYGYSYGRRQPLYQAPRFQNNYYLFNDLLAFAPGMNTTQTDVLGVLEAEARPDPTSAPGAIAPGAAALIAKARKRGWSQVVVPRRTGAGLTVHVDGQGRFRYERRLSNGLKELVVCNGTTLWHLYPELGVGARRVVSRFQRDELRRLVPWFLPPAADLARGNDLRLQGPNVVAIVPRGQAKGKPSVRLELHFAPDGRLSERRWVRVAAGETATVGKEVYAASGNVRWFDQSAVQIATRFLTVKAAEAPSLTPQTRELLVLPLPIRTQQHVLKSINRPRRHLYKGWKEEYLLAYATSCFVNNGWVVQQIYNQAFRPKGDRRLGWFVLTLASGARWNQGAFSQPQAGQPGSLLAKYLTQCMEISRRGWRYDQIFKNFQDPQGGPPLLRDLMRLRYVLAGWQGGVARRGKPTTWLSNMRTALRFAQECGDARLAWAMQNMVLTYGYRYRRHPDVLAAAEKVLERFAGVPGLDHAAHYEQARAMWSARKYPQAAKAFRALYERELKRGRLPKVDHVFMQAIRREGRQAWAGFVRSVSLRLVKERRRSQAVSLAWQCWQLGDRPMANETLETALTGIQESQRLATTLAAIEYLWWTQQPARADTLVLGLLKGKRVKDPGLWRLGAHVAQRNGKAARALKCLERALEMEFKDLPDVLNLQALRQDYGQLLGYYQKVADAVATLEQKPPLEFVARVVRAADRWRSLDPTPDQPCQLAAKVLQTLRVNDLAWEYLTTPLAKRPGESGPWLSLARRARGWGNYDLADRAFVNAFDAERTNAQILWERAQLLQQAGHSAKARALFRQLAEGKWQPRFRWIQQWAKSYVGQ